MERLFVMIMQELNDEYLEVIEEHLRQMTHLKGVLPGQARLGAGNQGGLFFASLPRRAETGSGVCFPASRALYGTRLLPGMKMGSGHSVTVLQDEGLVLVASAMAQSTAHLLNFFRALRAELGFYIACLNLAEVLNHRNVPQCFPVRSTKGAPSGL
jgi:hypothetical protein